MGHVHFKCAQLQLTWNSVAQVLNPCLLKAVESIFHGRIHPYNELCLIVFWETVEKTQTGQLCCSNKGRVFDNRIPFFRIALHTRWCSWIDITKANRTSFLQRWNFSKRFLQLNGGRVVDTVFRDIHSVRWGSYSFSAGNLPCPFPFWFVTCLSSGLVLFVCWRRSFAPSLVSL